MWWVLLALFVALIVAIVLIAMIVRRGQRQARASRDQAALESPGVVDTDDRLALLALIRDLRPSFTRSIKHLKSVVRGIDFRYGVPWYVMIGPAGSGKTTLVDDARGTALTPGGPTSNRAGSIGWHYFDGGVVIDVSAALALPGARGDSSGWRALLHLLRRYRPRRPADGIILAIPASILTDETARSRVQDLGAAIRDRLALAQSAFGFALPVYVVVTRADEIRGFSAFTGALPDNLLQDMLGWSNPHSADMLFQGNWVSEGFDTLHRAIVHTQVELLGASQQVEQPGELFLFSGELQRVAAPLRMLLEEIFRPTVYEAAFFFRGFYLAGRHPERGTVTEFRDPALRNVAFVGDLLDRKVFAERGLAAPLSGTAVGRSRGSFVAQIAAAVLAMLLAGGTYWTYGRLRHAQATHAQFFNDVTDTLELRRQVAAKQRSTTGEEQIAQGFSMLQSVERLSVENFHSIFYPASLVQPIEPAVAEVLTLTFGHLILPDFRVGLQDRARVTFGWSPAPASEDEDEDPISPVLDDSRRYRALKEFAQEYRTYIDNYFRYVELTGDERGDLTDLAAIGNYLTGRTNMVGHTVPDIPYGRALRRAVGTPIDCSVVLDPHRASLVGRKASALLTDFSTSWFGDDNPVLASENRFAAEWNALASGGEGDVRELVSALDGLTKSVATWKSIGGHSGELRIPVLDQAPFARIESTEICAPLAPDVSAEIAAIKKMRDALSNRLVLVGAEPFGRILRQDAKGLEFDESLMQLKTEFDELATKDFWAALPVGADGVLPEHATWPPESIDHALAMFASFDRYRSGAFKDFEPAFRRPLVAALTDEFARGIATRLSFDAAEAPPIPADSAALMEEVTRLGTLLTKVNRLVPLLNAANATFGRELVGALDNQAADVLQRLDQEATAHHPYVFGHQNDAIFNAWSDVQNEAATPVEATKRWSGLVDEQRESLRQYALRAEPLVRFLTATHASPALTRRWLGVVDDVTKSDQKIAGNGFGALDTFLREGLPAIVTEKDCAPAGVVRATGGFFVGIRNELVDDAVKRCRDVNRSGMGARYAAIASGFNRLLAGRFPFSVSADANVREASPADVVEFLRIYDRQDGRSLAQQIDRRSCTGDAAAFTRRISAAYPLFAPARELPVPAIALELTPEFRVNPEGEIGGNQIAQWQLEIGRQTLREGEPAKPVRWISGDPVKLQLRFAKDSPDRPVAGGRFAAIDDRTVHFDFQRGWALFALLRAGRPGPLDLVGVRDPIPNILRFEIPVARDPSRPPLTTDRPTVSPFRMYMRLRIFQPGKQDPLTIDDFPSEAPAQLSCPAS